MVNQGVLNWQQSPLYDTYELATTTATPVKIVFFENPTGATKGRQLTNMSDGFKLTPPEAFYVAALRFVALGTPLLDLKLLMQQYAATLIVSGKILLEAPVDYFAGGAGALIVGEASGAGTLEYAQNGVADPRAIAAIPVQDQILIDSGETFRVELNGATFTTSAALFLRCYLDGRYGRAIG